MDSVQERLKLKRITLDTWSTREKLALASAVHKSGDQNWSCVSRSIKCFAEPNRPADWFSPKNCAQQYASLLENAETPKRKKRSMGFTENNEVDTPGESIIKKLNAERVDELWKIMREVREAYNTLLDEANAIAFGEADDKIPFFLRRLEEQEAQKEREKEAHIQWLKEREERKLELERAWKPGVHLAHLRRTSSMSEPSSDADSPLNEPLNVDVPEEALAVKPTPTSPLLTSLLKSPASLTPSSSSILHSAITSPMRGVSPTIANLLNSSSVSNLSGPLGIPPVSQSPNLKNLVSSAIAGHQVDETKTILPQTPSQGAPTLSMLLELPPSMPGKPLPMIQPQAPPPYSEHLGPPPPYSLANEYLQKQKAEQAAQAQFVTASQKQPVQVADVYTTLLQLPQSAPATQVVEFIKTEPEPIKTEVIEPEESHNIQQEQVQTKVEEILPVKEAVSMIHTTFDHTYVDVPPETSEIPLPEEPAEIAEPAIVPTTPDKTSTPVTYLTPETPKEVPKPEKRADLDVFEFDEQEEVSGDVEDAKLSYLKSNAQRLAKKEAEASIRAETLRKSTETRVTDDEVEKVIEGVTKEEEMATEFKEECSLDENLEIVTHKPEDVPLEVLDTQVDQNEEMEKEAEVVGDTSVQTVLATTEEVPAMEDHKEVKEEVEAKTETTTDAPVDILQVEDSYSKIEKEEPEEPDVPKRTEALPIINQLEFSTTEDEKSNEAPARIPGTKRRGTLNVSDSVPNSPTPISEEEREYKSWKKSVLLILTRMMGHKSSSLFLKPISNDQAPGYSSVVYRPMDLTTLKRAIEAGAIRSSQEFQRDVMLMFFNAEMFNKHNSVVYKMAADMRKDIMEHIQMLLQATGGSQPSRRETRTQDKGETKTRTLRLSTKMDSKRKRSSTASETPPRKKIKVSK